MRTKLGREPSRTADEPYWYSLTLLHCGIEELVIVLKDRAKLLAATNEETSERSSVLWALSDAYSLVGDDWHVEETSAEAFAMMRRVNVLKSRSSSDNGRQFVLMLDQNIAGQIHH